MDNKNFRILVWEKDDHDGDWMISTRLLEKALKSQLTKQR